MDLLSFSYIATNHHKSISCHFFFTSSPPSTSTVPRFSSLLTAGTCRHLVVEAHWSVECLEATVTDIFFLVIIAPALRLSTLGSSAVLVMLMTTSRKRLRSTPFVSLPTWATTVLAVSFTLFSLLSDHLPLVSAKPVSSSGKVKIQQTHTNVGNDLNTSRTAADYISDECVADDDIRIDDYSTISLEARHDTNIDNLAERIDDNNVYDEYIDIDDDGEEEDDGDIVLELDTDRQESTDSETKPQLSTRPYQIVETEVWNGKKWQSPIRSSIAQSSSLSSSSSAFTTLSGRITAPPSNQTPPEGFLFVGEWKVVTDGLSIILDMSDMSIDADGVGVNKDDLAWEYTLQQPFPIRQRVWSRDVVLISAVEKLNPTITIVDSKYETSLRLKRQPLPIPGWIKAIANDWTFKGFGYSLFKPLLTIRSFGLAFRLPVTYNFDLWQRKRSLPSLSASVSVYYPWCVMVGLSGSIRLQAVHWAIARSLQWTQYIVLWTLWNVLLQGILLTIAAVLYPLTYQWWDPPMPWPKPPGTPPDFGPANVMEERIGYSVSWRYSLKRGYERRVSYWHYYGLTLTSIWQAALYKTKLATPPSWMAHRSATIGVSVGAPVPDEPYCSVTAALALSNYYRDLSKEKTKQVSEDSQPLLMVLTDDDTENDIATTYAHQSDSLTDRNCEVYNCDSVSAYEDNNDVGYDVVDDDDVDIRITLGDGSERRYDDDVDAIYDDSDEVPDNDFDNSDPDGVDVGDFDVVADRDSNEGDKVSERDANSDDREADIGEMRLDLDEDYDISADEEMDKVVRSIEHVSDSDEDSPNNSHTDGIRERRGNGHHGEGDVKPQLSDYENDSSENDEDDEETEKGSEYDNDNTAYTHDMTLKSVDAAKNKEPKRRMKFNANDKEKSDEQVMLYTGSDDIDDDTETSLRRSRLHNTDALEAPVLVDATVAFEQELTEARRKSKRNGQQHSVTKKVTKDSQVYKELVELEKFDTAADAELVDDAENITLDITTDDDDDDSSRDVAEFCLPNDNDDKGSDDASYSPDHAYHESNDG